MVTISPNGITLSANASANGFPPATFSVIYKVQRHEGDFAACDMGRRRRAERRERIADKRSTLDAR